MTAQNSLSNKLFLTLNENKNWRAVNYKELILYNSPCMVVTKRVEGFVPSLSTLYAWWTLPRLNTLTTPHPRFSSITQHRSPDPQQPRTHLTLQLQPEIEKAKANLNFLGKMIKYWIPLVKHGVVIYNYKTVNVRRVRGCHLPGNQ